MAESPFDTIHQQLSLADPNLDALLQNFPQSNLMHPFRQPATGSLGLYTPQTTHLLANDTQSLPPFEAEEPQRSQSLATSEFIRSTSILKASFLKTPTPSIGEISQLAAQTGLEQYGVSTWFDIIKGLPATGGANILPTPVVTQAILPQQSGFNVSEDFPPPPMDSDILRTKDRRNRPSQTKAATSRGMSPSGNNHPSKRQRKGQSMQRESTNLTLNDQAEPSRRRPSKALGEKQYFCPTSKCKFQTGMMDQWYTHQSRKHFPLEVFVCGKKAGTKPCRKGPDSPCKRRDNFVTHLKDSHGYQLGETLDREVSKRTVKVTGLFHDKCGFCSKTLDTRETSMDHIGAHIESGDNDRNWTHQCTSLDHKLESHLHFESFSDEKEPEDDNFDDDDDGDGSDDEDASDDDNGSGDEGYTDRDWTQGGDYHARDSGNDFDRNLEQDFDGGSSFGDAGGEFPPTNFTTASKSVKYYQESILEQVRFSENFERTYNPIIPLQSLVVQRTLGQGGSGTVFEVKHGNSQQSFALKTIVRTSSSSRASQFRACLNEVRVMTTLRHPHIVELLGFYIQPDCFSLLTAPVADTDLSRFMRMEASLGSSLFLDRSKILMRGMSSIAAALNYIHSPPVCGLHMDLKPANILIKSGNFLVADFGISKFRSLDEIPTTDNIQITPEYAAPETIKSLKQVPACDIWSLGCVFLEMLTVIAGRNLSDFAEFRRTELGDKSFHMTLEKTNDWTRMLIVEQRRRNCSSDQDRHIPLDMIHEMLREDPDDRPTAREIWLRFPRCPCCVDCQTTKHSPTSSQHGIDDQALCPISIPSTSQTPFATHVNNWPPAKSPFISDLHSAAPDKPTSRIERPSKSPEGSWSRRGPDIQSGIKLESLGDDHEADNLYADAAGTSGDWRSPYASTSKPTGSQIMAAADCGEARTFIPSQKTSWSLYPDQSDGSISKKKCTCIACLDSGVEYSHPSYVDDKGLICRFPGCLTFLDKQSSQDYISNFHAHERSHYGHSGSYMCLEPGCRFGCKRFSDLRRHYQAKHCIKPVQFTCPVVGCKYSGHNGFTRKDKLRSHYRLVHEGKPRPAEADQVLKPATLRFSISNSEGSVSKQENRAVVDNMGEFVRERAAGIDFRISRTSGFSPVAS